MNPLYKCYLNPQNEGQDMNYVERFQGTLVDLISRCAHLQQGMQKLLPSATITINIETYTGDVRFDNGKFFKDGAEIIMTNVQPVITEKPQADDRDSEAKYFRNNTFNGANLD